LKLEQQNGQVDRGQQGVIILGGPRAQVLQERKRKIKLERAYINSHRTPDKTGEILQI
jgi:GMP synthase-like glutamine amidotransferase